MRGGSERGHGEETVGSTVNEGRFQGGKEWLTRKAYLREEEGSVNG